MCVIFDAMRRDFEHLQDLSPSASVLKTLGAGSELDIHVPSIICSMEPFVLPLPPVDRLLDGRDDRGSHVGLFSRAHGAFPDDD